MKHSDKVLDKWKAHPYHGPLVEGSMHPQHAVKVVRRLVSVVEEVYYVPYDPTLAWGHNDQPLTCKELEREAESQVKHGRIEPYRIIESDSDVIVSLDTDKYDLYTTYIKHTMENNATLGHIKLHPQNDDCGSEEPCERPQNNG